MVWGANAQARYVAERYPKVPGITTYFIGSSTCHEGAYFKQNGLEFGRMPELSERGDLKYLGMDEVEVVLEGARGRATMRLFHPGGGTAYALSYRPQKIVESFGGGDKPNLLVVGHYHKMEYIPALRNVHTIQAGCLEYQSPFMRKLSIEAHRGFWVVLATIEEDGSVTRLRAEAFRFYEPARKQVARFTSSTEAR